MTNKLSLFFLAVFILISCGKNNHNQCLPARPTPMSQLSFRIIDKNTGEELLKPSKLDPADITISQNCNNLTSFPIRIKEGYAQVNNGDLIAIDSSGIVYSFSFDGLKAKELSESEDCEVFYIHWNNADTDTIRFTETYINECERRQNLEFNGQSVPLTVNGFRLKDQTLGMSIYALKK